MYLNRKPALPVGAVFADPLTDRASAVIVAHNHPSGSLEPSSEDRAPPGSNPPARSSASGSLTTSSSIPKAIIVFLKRA